MKKTYFKGLMLAVLSMLVFAGCGADKGSAELKLKNGILSWDAVKNAVSYEVDIGNGGKQTKDTSYNLLDACDNEGKIQVAVRSINEKGERSDVGSLEITTEKLDRPVIGIEEKEEKLFFSWSEVSGAKSYTYDAHDGQGLQKATADEDGKYRVEITDDTEQIIRVVANGTSKDECLYLSGESSYTYKTGRVFDMSLLGIYKAVYTAGGELQYQMKIGTTLSSGVYKVELSMYVMNSQGGRVTGNGIWGRRILTNEEWFWFCESEVEDGSFKNNMIPNPDEVYKIESEVTVDRGGNLNLNVYDFTAGDKLVIADVVYQGKSVLNASGGTANPVEEVQKLDVSDTSKYLAVYTGNGKWYDDDPESTEIEIPMNLSDGTHTVSIDYYVCKSDGDMLEGNGMWGRRLTGTDKDKISVWLNEYDLTDSLKGVDIPLPTKKNTSTFSVEVKNKKGIIRAMDFGVGDMVLIEKVKTSSVTEKNGTFISNGDLGAKFKVKTTLTETAEERRHTDVELTVTYRVHDIFGNAVTGNGSWGRRMLVGGKTFWFCETEVNGPDSMKPGIPKADQEITEVLKFSEINRYGVLTFEMWDFAIGDVLEITSIKYNGQEVLVK